MFMCYFSQSEHVLETVCFDFKQKMESYDEALAHVLQPSGISKLKTEQKVTLGDLMESKDRTGIT